jgi:hypothetical protein
MDAQLGDVRSPSYLEGDLKALHIHKSATSGDTFIVASSHPLDLARKQRVGR